MLFKKKKKETKALVSENNFFYQMFPIHSHEPEYAVTQDNDLYQKADIYSDNVVFARSISSLRKPTKKLVVLNDGDIIAVCSNGIGIFVQLVDNNIAFANVLNEYIQNHCIELDKVAAIPCFSQKDGEIYTRFNFSGHVFHEYNFGWLHQTDESLLDAEEQSTVLHEKALLDFYGQFLQIFCAFHYEEWIDIWNLKGMDDE